VEETPKGWFITLIRRDTLEELDKEARAKRERAEMEEEERTEMAIRQQVAGRGAQLRWPALLCCADELTVRQCVQQLWLCMISQVPPCPLLRCLSQQAAAA
jgi:hypothetical protein